MDEIKVPVELIQATVQPVGDDGSVNPTSRIAELEEALQEIRALARFELKCPSGLFLSCFSRIENVATLALAGCETYDQECNQEYRLGERTNSRAG